MKKATQISFIFVIIVIIVIILFLLIGPSLDFLGDDSLIGGERDENGCLGSAGYSYDREIKACMRIWELDEEQMQAGKTAVEHVIPYYSLTIESVEILECFGCFTVYLTDKDFKQIRIGIVNNEIVYESGM